MFSSTSTSWPRGAEVRTLVNTVTVQFIMSLTCSSIIMSTAFLVVLFCLVVVVVQAVNPSRIHLIPKKPTRVAAPSPRASLGRRTVCGRTEQRRPPVSKRYETKVRMVWGSFLIAAVALKTPTRNGNNTRGVNLTCCFIFSRGTSLERCC